MKLKNILITSALAASALVTVPAFADVDNLGPNGASGKPNDYWSILSGQFIGPDEEIEGFFGANIYLTGTADLEFDYFGAEAGWENEFEFQGGTLFTVTDHSPTGLFGGPGAPLNALPVTFNGVSEGLLDFRFLLNGSSTVTVVNGTNWADLSQPNFFSSFGFTAENGDRLPDVNDDEITPNYGNYVWLFLDDGGANADDNHDDMLVRITAKGAFLAPEPATLSLLGLGLVGLGALRRRKTA